MDVQAGLCWPRHKCKILFKKWVKQKELEALFKRCCPSSQKIARASVHFFQVERHKVF
jgi:hypothetical protein